MHAERDSGEEMRPVFDGAKGHFIQKRDEQGQVVPLRNMQTNDAMPPEVILDGIRHATTPGNGFVVTDGKKSHLNVTESRQRSSRWKAPRVHRD